MRASRKRRRADGRLASPPLAPSPLAQRNLQLLPVGLTQLPNDVDFVKQLQADIDGLLSKFAQVCLLTLVQHQDQQADVSPFAIFAQLYVQHGWHLTQFAFGDHSDSKRDFGNSICRVLLQRLRLNRTGFAHLKDLFEEVAVPFALYTLWDTQLCPDSGIGVKPNRRDMATIPVEQDVYDYLLQLPHAVLEHLEAEPMSRPYAHAIVADLTEVMCRLCGVNTSASASSKGKQKQQDTQGPAPIFDVIPATQFGTRRPRIWPSVQIMSTREADKHFGRVGNIVRVHESEADNGEPVRERVTGLSRGDLIRIRARQRLDWALADLPELQSSSSDEADTQPASSSDHGVAPQTQSQNGAKRPRYEVEMSPYITKVKYTAKLKPWLDATSGPLEHALDRLSQSRTNYDQARASVMSTLNEHSGPAAQNLDFSSSLIESFVARVTGEGADEAETSQLPAPVEVSSDHSVQQLYQTAAQQTRLAIMAMSEQINARTTRNSS